MITKSLNIILFLIFAFVGLSSFAQIGRLENEYKLSVPASESQDLWNFITKKYGNERVNISNVSLEGLTSREIFFDTYFDNTDKILLENKTGVRYRKRYKDNQLINEIIQLKMPQSEDGVIRNEIKFRVKKSLNSQFQKHPLLKFLSKGDITTLGFHISRLNLRPEDLKTEVELKQDRKRVYLTNSENENYLTITLDEVSNRSFPFQEFTELEIELNEIRYTDADEKEKQRMAAVSEELKKSIHTNFPNIKVDQTPKYNKMSALIGENWLSSFGQKYIWLVYGLILLLAAFKAFKLNFS